MDFVIFRAGKYLLGGQVRERRGAAYVVDLLYKVTKPMLRLSGSGLAVHENLILKKVRTHEELSRLVGANALPEGKAEAWEALRDGLPQGDLAKEEVQIATATLEAVRDRLGHLGILHPKRPVLGTFGECRDFHAFMKDDPFRDITKIHEGTVVGVVGYARGCAVVEADGETFWVPVEDLDYIESKPKDAEYYFNQDYNRDGIPDLLTSLPSHDQLRAGYPFGVSAKDNWNCYPQQHKVAGNIYPLKDIDMDDVSILKGELPDKSKYTSGGIREKAAVEFNYFYHQHKPGLHAVSGPSVQDVVSALIAGYPVEPMFIQDHEYADLEKAYLDAFQDAFPGVEPDLAHLRRLHGSE